MPERKPKPTVEERAGQLNGLAMAAIAVDRGGTGGAIAMFEAHLRRIVKRASLAPDMERVEIVQTYGPTLEFTGRLLVEGQEDRATYRNHREIWQTEAGNLVAVYRGNDERGEMVAATVCDAGDHLAAMDAFRWNSYARTLAKKLDWSLRVEVD